MHWQIHLHVHRYTKPRVSITNISTGKRVVTEQPCNVISATDPESALKGWDLWTSTYPRVNMLPHPRGVLSHTEPRAWCCCQAETNGATANVKYLPTASTDTSGMPQTLPLNQPRRAVSNLKPSCQERLRCRKRSVQANQRVWIST